MILIDTNIIMYAAGAPHANKQPSVRLLERIASGEIEAAINTETLQEILHRYRSIRRWTDGRQVYDLARQIFPIVISVTAEHLDHARRMLDEHRGLMARDALHAALLIDEKFESIYSYDRDFDRIAGVRRVEP
ncbi:MAG: type II toxin-antitoxin system VapC family toxin [Gemmatimonadaceae bacterium]